MAHIVLFHSILGLRSVERQIASDFETDGHTVILPNLFDGRSENDYDRAFQMKDDIGDSTILARAKATVDKVPADAVFAGVSFGAYLIGEFWNIRPKMPGALLISGVAPWMTPRRPGFKVSAHIARPDPFDDEKYFSDWVSDAGDVEAEVYRYDDAGHYFLDPKLSDYEPAAAKLCMVRCRTFLKNLSAR